MPRTELQVVWATRRDGKRFWDYVGVVTRNNTSLVGCP